MPRDPPVTRTTLPEKSKRVMAPPPPLQSSICNLQSSIFNRLPLQSLNPTIEQSHHHAIAHSPDPGQSRTLSLSQTPYAPAPQPPWSLLVRPCLLAGLA